MHCDHSRHKHSNAYLRAGCVLDTLSTISSHAACQYFYPGLTGDCNCRACAGRNFNSVRISVLKIDITIAGFETIIGLSKDALQARLENGGEQRLCRSFSF